MDAEGEPAERFAAPRQLIMTIYGLYAREVGGGLSVATLIELLGQLGVEEPAIRSAISRLKRRGMLCSSKVDSAAGYTLSEQARDILLEGDERIFRAERGKLTDGWVLATFSVPEAQRHRRHLLRSQLTKLGFGLVAPGVWIAPAHLRHNAMAVLHRLELDEYADVFHADHLAFGELSEKIAHWWDLNELRRLYLIFLEDYQPVLAKWRRRRSIPGREAFVDYVRVLTDWRRLPYSDPGLPAELLPANWEGARAAEVFFALKEKLEDAAHEHVLGG